MRSFVLFLALFCCAALPACAQRTVGEAEDGSPSHIRIARPVGCGLDEAAASAAARYRFAPATQNGKPVKVDVYIDVNFQIL